MKPIVIAGNGPSLKEIDYKRLPKEFDVFRCNLFFLEDKYYLGKDVTSYFMRIDTLDTLFATSSVLNINKEYNIQNRYFPGYATNWTKESLAYFYSLKYASDMYRSHEIILRFLDEWVNTYQKYPTTGIVMILTAVALGYTEIYVTGIEFFKTKDGNRYGFSIDQKSDLAQNSNFSNTGEYASAHSEETDRAAIDLVKTFEDVKIYCLSENTELSKLLPLAPVQNDSPYIPEDKPEGYLKDIVLSFEQQKEEKEKLLHEEYERNQGIKQKIKNIFIKKDLVDEWDFIRQNSLVRFVYQTIKLPYIILKIIIKLIK